MQAEQVLSGLCSIARRSRAFPLSYFKAVKPVEQFGDHIALKDGSVLWADHPGLEGTNPLGPAP